MPNIRGVMAQEQESDATRTHRHSVSVDNVTILSTRVELNAKLTLFPRPSHFTQLYFLAVSPYFVHVSLFVMRYIYLYTFTWV